MGFCLKCKPVFGGFQFSTSHLLCFLQPLGKDGFQLARVLEAQLQVLKAANRCLAELRAVHGSQRFSNVGLCVTCQKQRGKSNSEGSWEGYLPWDAQPLTAGSVGSVCCRAHQVCPAELTSEPCSGSCCFLCSVTLI